MTYSSGHLDYLYTDVFGDYTIQKDISSSGEIDYFGISGDKYQNYENITHGILGFADTQYQIPAGDLRQVGSRSD